MSDAQRLAQLERQWQAIRDRNTHYAAVICPNCGQVPLHEREYTRQLSDPWKTWRCPKCRDDAEFDDDYFEHHHGIADEVSDDEPAF